MYGFNDDRSKVNANWLNGSQIGSVRTIGSAEEDSNYTIGRYAIAEGQATEASGITSHAEGNDTIASAMYSHAEGNSTTASGNNSHAEGVKTRASGFASHVQGKFNIEDDTAYTSAAGTIFDSDETYYTKNSIGYYEKVSNPTAADIASYYTHQPYAGTQAFIIGNGTSSARSNALTVDWDGNLEVAGKVTSTDMTSAEVTSFLEDVPNGVGLNDIGQENADLIAGDLTQTLALSNSFTGSVKYDKIGSLVIVYFNIVTASAISSDTVIGSGELTSGYRPLTETEEYVRTISNIQLSVNTSGVAKLLVNGESLSSGTIIKGEVAYYV